MQTVEERLKNQAMRQMLDYNNKNTKQKIKDILKKVLGRYVAPKDLISWPTGLLANALSENHEIQEENSEVRIALEAYFDRWIQAGMPIYYIDDVLCGIALLDLYQVSGNEKYKAGVDAMVGYLYNITNMDKAGSIPYRHKQNNQYIFVDGIGMMCPFLCKYGKEMQDGKAIALAMIQIQNMLKYGMDEKSMLPYHGYEYKSGIKYGIIGWGRAVGWLLMGMSGMLQYLTEDKTNHTYIKANLCKIIDSAIKYQRQDGSFAWQLEAQEGPADSSATAMIVLAMIQLIQDGISSDSSYSDVVERALQYIVDCEKNGEIFNCSGECLGFSQYPQIYGAYPWSLGPGLAALKVYSGAGERV